eukprot:7222821-Alexandrium_andersonii.AAC.1
MGALQESSQSGRPPAGPRPRIDDSFGVRPVRGELPQPSANPGTLKGGRPYGGRQSGRRKKGACQEPNQSGSPPAGAEIRVDEQFTI